MRTHLTTLMLVITLGLVSCGGGNDGTSTGSPVVAQATVAQTVTACLASMTYGGTGPLLYGGTGPLLGRTTAPTLAQCSAVLPSAWTVYSNGGCGASMSFFGGGPWLTNTQYNACAYAISDALTNAECDALGGYYGCLSTPSNINIQTTGNQY